MVTANDVIKYNYVIDGNAQPFTTGGGTSKWITSIVGGVYYGTTQSVTSGTATAIRVDSNGNIIVNTSTGNTIKTETSSALDLTDASAANRTFTTAIGKNHQVSNIRVTFTSAESRDVNIYLNDGTNDFEIVDDDGDTTTTYIHPAAFDWLNTANDETKVVFSQTGSGCTATVTVVYEEK